MQRSWKVLAENPTTRCPKCSVEAHGNLTACLEREDQLCSRVPEGGEIDPLTSFPHRDEVSSSHTEVGGNDANFPTSGGRWKSCSLRRPPSPARGSFYTSTPFLTVVTQPAFLFSFTQPFPKTCYNFFGKQFDNFKKFKFNLLIDVFAQIICTTISIATLFLRARSSLNAY